jgi:hypothetical protein
MGVTGPGVTANGEALIGSVSDDPYDVRTFVRQVKPAESQAHTTDLPAWLRSFEKLKALAAPKLLFPGHDSLMACRYETVAENITRLV